MRRMREFHCAFCGSSREALHEDGTLGPECTGPYGEHYPRPMRPLISAPRFRLEGITGDYPSAADKWARVHQEAAKTAAKRNEGKYED